MAELLAQTPTISEGDVDNYALDLTLQLDGDELLTGSPTIVEIGTSDLLITSVSNSTSELEILGETVAIGKAVQATIQGMQKSQGIYRLEVTFFTDAGRTKVYESRFNVR